MPKLLEVQLIYQAIVLLTDISILAISCTRCVLIAFSCKHDCAASANDSLCFDRYNIIQHSFKDSRWVGCFFYDHV